MEWRPDTHRSCSSTKASQGCGLRLGRWRCTHGRSSDWSAGAAGNYASCLNTSRYRPTHGVLASVSTPVRPIWTSHGCSRPSSTSLGWSGALVAVGAAAEDLDDRDLEVAQNLVEAQAAPVAFGSVSRRRMVANRWAAVTRVAWWCQPRKVRPSKWSRPSPCLSSR